MSVHCPHCKGDKVTLTIHGSIVRSTPCPGQPDGRDVAEAARRVLPLLEDVYQAKIDPKFPGLGVAAKGHEKHIRAALDAYDRAIKGV